jgi:tetratricopeptide (TPR) repeat protein
MPLPERLALAATCVERAESSGSPEALAIALATLRYLRWEDQDILGSRLAGQTYEALVDELRMPRYLAGRAQRRAALALLRGDLDEAERQSQEMLRLQPNREFLEGYAAQTFAIRAEQGRLDEVLPLIDELGLGEQIPWRGAKAVCLVEAGDLDGARRHLEPYWKALPRLNRDAAWLASSCTAAMATAWLDEPEAAAALYKVLEPEAERAVVVGTGAICFGATARVLGPLALAMGDLDVAERWCRRSLEIHSQVDATPFQVADRLWLARVLEARGQPGDREEAAALVERSVGEARQLGLGGRLVELAVGAAPSAAPTTRRPPISG